jgi:hypothetical protein
LLGPCAVGLRLFGSVDAIEPDGLRLAVQHHFNGVAVADSYALAAPLRRYRRLDRFREARGSTWGGSAWLWLVGARWHIRRRCRIAGTAVEVGTAHRAGPATLCTVAAA